MNTRVKPVPPVMPHFVRDQLQLLSAPITPETIELGLLEAVLSTLTRTAEQQAAIDAYDAEIVEYNRRVREWSAPILRERQRRVNERQAAATYSATCQKCFCVHAGDECY